MKKTICAFKMSKGDSVLRFALSAVDSASDLDAAFQEIFMRLLLNHRIKFAKRIFAAHEKVRLSAKSS